MDYLPLFRWFHQRLRFLNIWNLSDTYFLHLKLIRLSCLCSKWLLIVFEIGRRISLGGYWRIDVVDRICSLISGPLLGILFHHFQLSILLKLLNNLIISLAKFFSLFLIERLLRSPVIRFPPIRKNSRLTNYYDIPGLPWGLWIGGWLDFSHGNLLISWWRLILYLFLLDLEEFLNKALIPLVSLFNFFEKLFKVLIILLNWL